MRQHAGDQRTRAQERQNRKPEKAKHDIWGGSVQGTHLKNKDLLAETPFCNHRESGFQVSTGNETTRMSVKYRTHEKIKKKIYKHFRLVHKRINVRICQSNCHVNIGNEMTQVSKITHSIKRGWYQRQCKEKKTVIGEELSGQQRQWSVTLESRTSGFIAKVLYLIEMKIHGKYGRQLWEEKTAKTR